MIERTKGEQGDKNTRAVKEHESKRHGGREIIKLRRGKEEKRRKKWDIYIF